MRYAIAVVVFFVATLIVTVWHNRGAELETAMTRTQVLGHCANGVLGGQYTADQFVPCMRAGAFRADINHHHKRTLRAGRTMEDALTKVRAARINLAPWTEK